MPGLPNWCLPPFCRGTYDDKNEVYWLVLIGTIRRRAEGEGEEDEAALDEPGIRIFSNT
jgi:hypothetical protein